jgi:hypothetical protein
MEEDTIRKSRSQPFIRRIFCPLSPRRQVCFGAAWKRPFSTRRSDNPVKAKEMKRLFESAKPLRLPEPEQFEKFVKEIETAGSGFSKPCAELVQFLAFDDIAALRQINGRLPSD